MRVPCFGKARCKVVIVHIHTFIHMVHILVYMYIIKYRVEDYYCTTNK